MSFLKGPERLPQCMLRLAQGALRLAHPQLRLKQRLLRLQDRNENLVSWVVVDDYRGRRIESTLLTEIVKDSNS